MKKNSVQELKKLLLKLPREEALAIIERAKQPGPKRVELTLIRGGLYAQTQAQKKV